MYVFLRSDDSISLYPNNNSSDFVCELSRLLLLPGIWECALVDCRIGSLLNREELTVYCDIVENSCVDSNFIPILNIISKSGSPPNPYYIPISRQAVKRIRFKLLDNAGNIFDSSKITDSSRFILHLRQKE